MELADAPEERAAPLGDSGVVLGAVLDDEGEGLLVQLARLEQREIGKRLAETRNGK